MAINTSILLFDLDGTLTDPKEGILNSIQYALKKKGIHEAKPDELSCFIGPPLHLSFQKRYHLSELEAFEMVGLFANILPKREFTKTAFIPGFLSFCAS
ncbi:MAG TPA: hypothetical protein DCG69_12375 [Bacteroidales bacterium]|nr:hypothetical protein [Bacteroidales bacterium]